MKRKIILNLWQTALFAGFALILAKPTYALTISQISYSESGRVVGTYVDPNNSTLITFTPPTALINTATITLTFPSGTTLTSANLTASDFTISQATSGLCVNAGSDTAPSNISVNATNRTITLTVASGSLSKTVLSADCGLGIVTIKTSGTFAGSEVRHPTTVTTSGVLTIDTSLLDSGSKTDVTFIHDTASQLIFTTQPSSTATAGTNLTTQPVITVQDQYGNTATGSSASITLAAVLASDTNTSGNGTLSATTNPLSATSGVATFAAVKYTKAENIKLKATSSGLTQSLSNTITVSPGAATTLSKVSGDTQTAGTNTTLSAPFVIIVYDANSNPVPDITVNYSITTLPTDSVNQSLSDASDVSDVNGQASTTLTLGDTAGDYIVTASSTGLTSLTFTATATDSSPPTMSNISSTPGSTSVSITWTTDETSNTQIDYGLTSSYTNSTVLKDSTPKVISHTDSISNLVSCTQYHYSVKSSDPSGNQATSSDQTFITTGCTGSAAVEALTNQTISSNGGSLNLLEPSTGPNLIIPRLRDSDTNFQILRLNADTLVNFTATPTNTVRVGNHVYELKALSDVSTPISSFTQSINISITHQDSDIANLDPGSLRIYRYSNNTWSPTQNCSLNIANHRISCSTTGFSTFALFGTTKSTTQKASSSAFCSAYSPNTKKPTIYAAVPEGNNAIRLYFTPGDGASHHVLRFGTNSQSLIYGSLNIGSGTARSYLVSHLQPNAVYHFEVGANNDCQTNWSEQFSASTKKKNLVTRPKTDLVCHLDTVYTKRSIVSP